jgi:V/A-type H+-transporting ATPase subunit A
MALLQREVELMEIVQLVGPDALAEAERAVLAAARMLREDFLQQSAYHDIDRYCPIEKAYWMLKTVLDFHHLTQTAVQSNIPLDKITALPVVVEIGRMKEMRPDQAVKDIQALLDRVNYSFAELGVA